MSVADRPAGPTPEVAVIGAGAVGVCIAYELCKRGAQVTLFDRDEPGSGCSWGNSGAISPGSVMPMATPGVLASLPGMLLDRERPLYVRLSYLPQAAPWLLSFLRSAGRERVMNAVQRLAALHAGAVEKHQALAHEVGVPELFIRRGHLHVYPSERAFASDALAWQVRADCGYPHERLDRAGIVELEPAIGPRYQVGAFLTDQATILNPARYVKAVAAAFTARGGRWRQAPVRALRPSNTGWSLELGDANTLHCSHAVVAAGAWSRQLLDPLGVHVALESQRGYHVQFASDRDKISRTVVLADHKVFVTPMEEGLRVGGTVEFAGLQRPPDWRRATVLERIARAHFPGLGASPPSRWAGHRPCMPDSVPVIGPVTTHPRLWLAVGHGHLGLTDSVHTGERIADALLGASHKGSSAPPYTAGYSSAAAA